MSREFGSMLTLGHSVLVPEELGLKHLESVASARSNFVFLPLLLCG